jgi:DNA polymerase-3 subunit epsilon
MHTEPENNYINLYVRASTRRQLMLDIETTGLNFGEDRIIEIGLIEVINLIPTGNTYHVFLNPESILTIDAAASAVHGLTIDQLLEQPAFSDISAQLRHFLSDSDIIVHNQGFDILFINHEFTRIGEPPINNFVIDTMQIAAQLGHTRKSLNELCKYYNINLAPRDKFHGAIIDAKLMYQVYCLMIAPSAPRLDFNIIQYGYENIDKTISSTYDASPMRVIHNAIKTSPHSSIISKWRDYINSLLFSMRNGT